MTWEELFDPINNFIPHFYNWCTDITSMLIENKIVIIIIACGFLYFLYDLIIEIVEKIRNKGDENEI